MQENQIGNGGLKNNTGNSHTLFTQHERQRWESMEHRVYVDRYKAEQHIWHKIQWLTHWHTVYLGKQCVRVLSEICICTSSTCRNMQLKQKLNIKSCVSRKDQNSVFNKSSYVYYTKIYI